jgi:hypothetical protein
MNPLTNDLLTAMALLLVVSVLCVVLVIQVEDIENQIQDSEPIKINKLIYTCEQVAL